MSKTKKKKEEELVDEPMTLSGHLRELKNRLIVILIVFAIGLAIGLSCSRQIVQLLMDMGADSGYQFVFIAPQELMMVYVQVGLVFGVVVAMPVIVYEAYQFALPALTRKESRSVRNALFFGFGMFIIGVLFAYFISLPFMLYFLISLNSGTAIEASISIQEFVSFVLTIFVIFGVVFELPVITSLLTMLGLLKPEYLVKARKIAIVLIFLLAAIITPPDIVSQTMVAFPMIGLYQVGIMLSQAIYKHRHISDEEESESENV